MTGYENLSFALGFNNVDDDDDGDDGYTVTGQRELHRNGSTRHS